MKGFGLSFIFRPCSTSQDGPGEFLMSGSFLLGKKARESWLPWKRALVLPRTYTATCKAELRGFLPQLPKPALRESFHSFQGQRPCTKAAWPEDTSQARKRPRAMGCWGWVGRKILEVRVPSSQLQQLGLYPSHQGAMSCWLTASHVGRA